jgi:hypothetical protein
MDPIIQSLFADLEAKDKNVQYEAFKKLLAVTEKKWIGPMRCGTNLLKI